jgi:mono/diheme cytochrome c family protein
MIPRHALAWACLAAALATACGGPAERPTSPVDVLAEADRPGIRRQRIIDVGEQVFATHCATCHGLRGRGDGQNASRLQPPPPDVAHALARDGVDYVRRVIRDGSAGVGRSPLCPPRAGQLTADQLDALAAYVEWLACSPAVSGTAHSGSFGARGTPRRPRT